MTWPSIPTHTFLDDFSEWCFDHNALGFAVFMSAILLGGAAIVCGIMLITALLNRGRPSVTLFEDEWTATRTHQEARTSMILVGKVLVPQTRTVTVVDQWTRRR